ncbi:hypothetical protein Sgleb_43170 [Streptomyces glebosus]|uniref:Uncharacterized protein n=1 Tax=Streptomyces glebosus TaxID=249580 RepID=A0A640SZ88_9ACTN|nr:hypothetical protein Sgleb_43170 [Streptomyces glebosus]GHG63910.1 hypothetical protein GCM10010513_31530 [Streptomyces glebosus]
MRHRPSAAGTAAHRPARGLGSSIAARPAPSAPSPPPGAARALGSPTAARTRAPPIGSPTAPGGSRVP